VFRDYPVPPVGTLGSGTDDTALSGDLSVGCDPGPTLGKYHPTVRVVDYTVPKAREHMTRRAATRYVDVDDHAATTTSAHTPQSLLTDVVTDGVIDQYNSKDH
jgi:hypothetical protein